MTAPYVPPPQSLAATLAVCTDAYDRCVNTGNTEWRAIWAKRLTELRELLPSGSGIDNGTKTVSVTAARITMTCEFHHHGEHGYNGWTTHRITVRPSWNGIEVTVAGPNRDDIREYLHQVYDAALSQLVAWDDAAGRYVAVIQ